MALVVGFSICIVVEEGFTVNFYIILFINKTFLLGLCKLIVLFIGIDWWITFVTLPFKFHLRNLILYILFD